MKFAITYSRRKQNMKYVIKMRSPNTPKFAMLDAVTIVC